MIFSRDIAQLAPVVDVLDHCRGRPLTLTALEREHSSQLSFMRLGVAWESYRTRLAAVERVNLENRRRGHQ